MLLYIHIYALLPLIYTYLSLEKLQKLKISFCSTRLRLLNLLIFEIGNIPGLPDLLINMILGTHITIILMRGTKYYSFNFLIWPIPGSSNSIRSSSLLNLSASHHFGSSNGGPSMAPKQKSSRILHGTPLLQLLKKILP
jgi:hypothetical protein